MRAALLMRPDAETRPGGDVVQATAVARHLRRIGLEVVELRGWDPDLAGFDAAVVMNLTVPEQVWLHARACVRAGVPYLLLPVFWDLAEAIPAEHRPTGSVVLPVGSRRRDVAQRLRLAARAPGPALATAGRRLPTYLAAPGCRLVEQVVSRASAVCPNSVAELEHLADYTGLTPTPGWRVVRNGLDVAELPSVQQAVGTPREDVVISVGALSPRKNSLGLVRAARALDCPLLIAGQHPRPGDAYARRVMDEAPPNVVLLGSLPRAEVLQRMMTAAVHVQPGFVETPGLASLEAAALGTPVVVSDTAPVREYFGDAADYAEPGDVLSLVDALSRARARAPDAHVATRIREAFDWSRALEPLGALLAMVVRPR